MGNEAEDLQAETLTGDVRDVLLTHVRSMDVGWRFLSESQQREKIHALEKCAEDLVRRTVRLISDTGFPAIPVEVGAVKIDKGVEIKVTAVPTVENITHLAEHGKHAATLVLVEAAEFFGERDKAEPDPDEPALPLDEEAA